jgi:hypothetical protein
MWSRRSVVATGFGALRLAGARRAGAAATTGDAADRVEIQELVQRERLARDLEQWDVMGAAYHPDAAVDISWFSGTGSEFVAASRKAAERGLLSFHMMGPTVTTIEGTRALAESAGAIHIVGKLDGAEVDVVGHARFFVRAERRTDRWLIAGFRVLYLQDMVVPLNPSHVPKINPAEAAKFRASYRYVSYMLAASGLPPRTTLPGVDRPKTAKALLDGETAWLLRKA